MKSYSLLSIFVAALITFGMMPRLQACKEKKGQRSSCVDVSEKLKSQNKKKTENVKSLRLTASDSSDQISEHYPSQNDPAYYRSCYDKAGHSKQRCE